MKLARMLAYVEIFIIFYILKIFLNTYEKYFNVNVGRRIC